MTSFNLKYTHKVTGKVHMVKRVEHWNYRIQCPDTGVVSDITRQGLLNDFVGDKKNRGVALREIKNVAKKRNVQTKSKAFRDYLKERSA